MITLMNTIKYILAALFMQLAAISYTQQTTWEYVLRTPDIDEETFTMTEGIDGSFYIGGRSLLLGQEYPYKSLVFKLNQQGTLVDSIHFTFLGKWTSLSQIIPANNDNFVLLSTFRNSFSPFSNGGLMLHSMNSNLQLSNQTLFWADTNHRIIASIGSSESFGNLFINFAVTVPVSYIKSYLIETDSNFKIIKQKFLTDHPRGYSHLKKLDENTYWGLNLYSTLNPQPFINKINLNTVYK